MSTRSIAKGRKIDNKALVGYDVNIYGNGVSIWQRVSIYISHEIKSLVLL